MLFKELLLVVVSGAFSIAYPTDATTKATGTDNLIELYLLMFETAFAVLDSCWVQADEMLTGTFSVIVIPKALLERKDVHVDIIFPSLDLLNTKLVVCEPWRLRSPFKNLLLLLSDLVSTYACINLKVTSSCFKIFLGGKKRAELLTLIRALLAEGLRGKQNTIKGVILISKPAPDELGKDNAVRRAKEICRLIKSLPEAQKLPIYAAVSTGEYGRFPRTSAKLKRIGPFFIFTAIEECTEGKMVRTSRGVYSFPQRSLQLSIRLKLEHQ
ncbi:unnamed protein product [Gongylonema pulchrum]|uniref:Secreted protein n=1 Tax=Gongylonema pulchrum TaxID=637853 RepID=A0A183DZ24_9BILA|nr:unnamed protein product [Gongylonema pulchrum]